MNNYSILDHINYQDKSTLVKLADYALTFSRIGFNGNYITIDLKGNATVEKTHHFVIKF